VEDSAAPPDAAPCWVGDWHRVDPLVDVWAQAALVRTVSTLPRLHPWRLGDTTGSSRLLQWVARLGHDPRAPLGVLAVTARDPQLDRSDDATGPVPTHVAAEVLARWAFSSALSAVGAVASIGSTPQWAGAMVRLPGSWLPPIAWLPRALRGLDDPAGAWPTESVDFETRYSVHSDDLRTAAALLTPAAMALALDDVPPLSAVTLAGDALHVWWPYRGDALEHVGRVVRGGRAARALADAFPRFVLAEHPDRSDVVEQGIAERRAAAAAYRASRRPGVSGDPVLQRIYDAARATTA
jgi:hypothetical protein